MPTDSRPLDPNTQKLFSGAYGNRSPVQIDYLGQMRLNNPHVRLRARNLDDALADVDLSKDTRSDIVESLESGMGPMKSRKLVRPVGPPYRATLWTYIPRYQQALEGHIETTLIILDEKYPALNLGSVGYFSQFDFKDRQLRQLTAKVDGALRRRELPESKKQKVGGIMDKMIGYGYVRKVDKLDEVEAGPLYVLASGMRWSPRRKQFESLLLDELKSVQIDGVPK